jgi:hypothetical protein
VKKRIATAGTIGTKTRTSNQTTETTVATDSNGEVELSCFDLCSTMAKTSNDASVRVFQDCVCLCDPGEMGALDDATGPSPDNDASNDSASAIVIGGVVGGLFLLALIVVAVIFYNKAGTTTGETVNAFGIEMGNINIDLQKELQAEKAKNQQFEASATAEQKAKAELEDLSARGINHTAFPKECDFPDVIMSYQSNSISAGVGKAYMWAVCNMLKAAAITSYNGYMVQGGEDWKEAWFGQMPHANIAIVMLSKTFLKSSACLSELKAICRDDKFDDSSRIIPVYLDDVKLTGNFLGDEPTDIRAAAFIKGKLGNCIPPPDQGLFHENFAANMKTLVARIKTLNATSQKSATM